MNNANPLFIQCVQTIILILCSTTRRRWETASGAILRVRDPGPYRARENRGIIVPAKNIARPGAYKAIKGANDSGSGPAFPRDGVVVKGVYFLTLGGDDDTAHAGNQDGSVVAGEKLRLLLVAGDAAAGRHCGASQGVQCHGD